MLLIFATMHLLQVVKTVLKQDAISLLSSRQFFKDSSSNCSLGRNFDSMDPLRYQITKLNPIPMHLGGRGRQDLCKFQAKKCFIVRPCLQTKKRGFIFISVCEYMSPMQGCQRKLEDGIESHGSAVIRSYVLPNMDAGNQTLGALKKAVSAEPFLQPFSCCLYFRKFVSRLIMFNYVHSSKNDLNSKLEKCIYPKFSHTH